MSRRNSPRIDQLNAGAAQQILAGVQSGGYARKIAERPAPGPAQGEMPGMETNASAALLIAAQKSAEAKRAKSASKEDLFDFQLRSHRFPVFTRQLRFAEPMGRRWTFDFACQQYMLAVEIEGLVVMRVNGELIVKGRHASITGFREDCIKYAAAAELGWTVLRFEQGQVKDGTALELTQRVLYSKGWRR